MRRLYAILLALLAALLIAQAAYSLRWPIAHDEAPLLYETFLMHSEGRVPYRDLFDFQMPGSFAAYYLLGRLSGFSGFFRLRLLDLGILAALLTVTFLFMRRFGKSVAFAAAILFGLKYMQGGAYMSLQREYLLLGFIASAIWLFMRDGLTYKHRLLIGILFGLAAAIKPHAAIGLLPILLFDITDLIQHQKLILIKSAAISILPTAIGFAIPIFAMIGWLAATHALTPFLDIVLHYVPLYAQINGQMEITASGTRIPFLLNQSLRLGGHALWLIPATLGVYLVPQENKRQAYLLASLAACYAIYPAFSGQFFEYHYIPFIYFIVLLASLALTEQQTLSTVQSPPSFLPSTVIRAGFPLSSLILLLTIAFTVRPSNTFLRQIDNRPIAKTTDRASEIAAYLKENMKAGDTVQPLDWTGGTLLAMLETRAPLATKYVFDFYFYHHVSTPYIKNLRADFMNEMHEANPRFIVEVIAVDKPWLTGADTTREFPELRAFLNANYSVTIHEDDYLIYERK